MIAALVRAALKNPFVAYLFTAALVVAGIFSYRQLDIEAYPNPVPPLVEVIALPNGMSAEDVERYVTIPLETQLAGMPGLEHVRSQSLFGLADVKCYFSWSIEYKDARQEVLNRLASLDLPNGVTAEISPWNAIGEVFRYQVVGKGYTLAELKTAQDWILERQFKQVPGVVDVVSFGGETKQYQVEVDPFRLRSHSVTLPELMTAVANANRNVGGQRLSLGEQAYTVRGVGLVKNVHDIEDVVISARDGIPVRVKDVATVHLGAAPRLGIVGHDNDGDAVQGVVLMRYGEETKATLTGIHAKVDAIRKNHLLPPGMDLVPYYDRGALVETTTHTVLENLVVGMVLVFFVLWAFLGHTKAALITAINIPLALCVAFSGMVASKTQANLISLGAVDFGIVVDSTVIVVESIFRHLGSHGRGSLHDRILAGAAEVSRPLLFSTIILGVAFFPLFTMTGVAGVIFAPLAKTYALAIGGAIFLALTATPTLCASFLSKDEEEKDSFVMRTVNRLDAPLLRWVGRAPAQAVAVGGIVVAIGLAAFPFLGGEFLPKLEEGNFWIRVTLPTSISLEQSAKYVGRMRDIVRGCPKTGECTDANRSRPEIETVVSQLGRPDDGTDSAGFQNIELFAPLRPMDKWRKGMSKEKLTEEMSAEFKEAFPGAIFNFSQMIGDNVEEATSGVKGENAVKVFGPDIATNEKNATVIEDAIGKVAGVTDVGLFPSTGQPSVKITPDRPTCARYGLNTGDVEAVVEAAIGGKAVSQVYEGDRVFDLTVRWQEPFRASIEAIREITVPTPSGATIPLGQLAQIKLEDSASVVFREDAQRYTPVKFSVRGRDLESTVQDARTTVAKNVKLPYDSHVEWDGELNELGEAKGRLAIVVPLTLLVIALLVKTSVGGMKAAFAVFVNIPVAVAGGILALLVARIHFSVSAAMGFVSVFGIAVQYGMLMVSQFQVNLNAGLGPREAALEASRVRTRPILMTTLVALFGLLPAALSHGIGSETQKPLAVVVIGGALLLVTVARFFLVGLLAVLWRNHTPGTPTTIAPPPHDRDNHDTQTVPHPA